MFKEPLTQKILILRRFLNLSLVVVSNVQAAIINAKDAKNGQIQLQNKDYQQRKKEQRENIKLKPRDNCRRKLRKQKIMIRIVNNLKIMENVREIAKQKINKNRCIQKIEEVTAKIESVGKIENQNQIYFLVHSKISLINFIWLGNDIKIHPELPHEKQHKLFENYHIKHQKQLLNVQIIRFQYLYWYKISKAYSNQKLKIEKPAITHLQIMKKISVSAEAAQQLMQNLVSRYKIMSCNKRPLVQIRNKNIQRQKSQIDKEDSYKQMYLRSQNQKEQLLQQIKLYQEKFRQQHEMIELLTMKISKRDEEVSSIINQYCNQMQILQNKNNCLKRQLGQVRQLVREQQELIIDLHKNGSTCHSEQQ